MRARTPLRVAYLAQHYLPESGALPARVSEMAGVWIDEGAEVTVLTAMPHRPEGRIRAGYRGRVFMADFEHGVRVLRSWIYASPSHSTASTILNNVSFSVFSSLQALTSRLDCDVLIASEPPFFPHLNGTALAWYFGMPLVLEIRDLWPDYVAEMQVLPRPAERALFGLERSLLRRAEHVVTVTESFRRRVIEKGVKAERVSVVSNGVDSEFYRPSGSKKRSDSKTVGYVGNFGRGQGLEQVVGAAEVLLQLRPDLRFVLIGDGPTRGSIAALARRVDPARIEVRDPIPKSATCDFYNNCDVVLVPHAPLDVLADTVPSKLFEVMACERPLVASVAGEAARIVRDSGGGFVARPGDPQSLAAEISRALNLSAAERAERGARARSYVQSHYSRAALARRYLEILRGVARQG